jgi:hypothetical protein
MNLNLLRSIMEANVRINTFKDDKSIELTKLVTLVKVYENQKKK